MNKNILLDHSIDDHDFIDTYVTQHKKELEELRGKANSQMFEGDWVIIGDKNYPKKRQQYATTSFEEADISPRIILYPKGESDIVKAINLCTQLKMAISVRTGGHQYCGFSSTLPQNMQIDLSKTFPLYDYNSNTNVLRCGVSHSLGSWAQKNHENGIYLPMGVCSHVHLGGHVHTGGWGMVARSHGILADHVLAFDIILANGEKERITRPEKGKTTNRNDDIYFAVLGGGKGGDFGIVTHWEFSPYIDSDYPNSACYTFTWLWSKKRMRRVVRQMAQFSKLCLNGDIPSDYEFMLTITGTGKMDLLTEPIKDGLKKLGILGGGSRLKLPESVNEELRELGILDGRRAKLLPKSVRVSLKKLLSESTSEFEKLSGNLEDQVRELGFIDDGVLVPPLIQMWMCYTNKGGEQEEFDDSWFETFTRNEVCGAPLLPFRLKNTPISKGLAQHFIMKQDREMEYPFIKRSRVTMSVPETFSETYSKRIYEIMGPFGTRHGQHLVSQQQIYAGGAVSEKGNLGVTSYSWRDQALAMSHDSFYSVSLLHPHAEENAAQWQEENDEAFIEEKGFADADMRMFAYTFGNRELEDVWHYYYDSQEKYDRLKKIKVAIDPAGLFSADHFSLKP